VAIAAEVMAGYGPLLEPPEVASRAAKVATTLKSRTPARLYVYDAVLQGLAQDLQDMPFELGQPVEEEDAVMRQRRLAGHGDLPAAD
jgi:hypothetical protein